MMHKQRWYVAAIFLVVWVVGFMSAALATTFESANALYAEGKYEEALDAYDGYLAQAGPSAELYYNMGNAYVQLNDRASAMLAYTRAEAYAPRDAMIKKNVSFLRSQFDYRIDDKTGWYIRQLRWLFSYVTDAEVLLSFLLSLALLLASVLLFVLTARRGFAVMLCIVTFCITVCAGSLYVLNVFVCDPGDHALVMEKAALRYGPRDNEKVVLMLPQAYPVYVIDRRASWSHVVLLNNDTGWVRNEYIELV